MLHRHLNSSRLTSAAIDDVISRGRRQDWIELREMLRKDRTIAQKIERVCRAHLANPYAQRYHFWMHYVREHAT